MLPEPCATPPKGSGIYRFFSARLRGTGKCWGGRAYSRAATLIRQSTRRLASTLALPRPPTRHPRLGADARPEHFPFYCSRRRGEHRMYTFRPSHPFLSPYIYPSGTCRKMGKVLPASCSLGNSCSLLEQETPRKRVQPHTAKAKGHRSCSR